MTRYWGWGVLGALVSGAVTAGATAAEARRVGLPRRSGRDGVLVAGRLLWEGVLYGAAEGVLLSALPVLAAWQSFRLLGWTDTTLGAIGSGALAVLASAVVIWVHHLGYREFRTTRAIVLPIIACGILSIAYLLTRSAIAPVGATSSPTPRWSCGAWTCRHIRGDCGLRLQRRRCVPHPEPLVLIVKRWRPHGEREVRQH